MRGQFSTTLGVANVFAAQNRVRFAHGDATRGEAMVSHAQRLRMLSAAATVVAEHGYEHMSVSRVTKRAGVSRRTFYELFEDREACFLAAFEQAIARVTGPMRASYEQELVWCAGVRAALAVLLAFMDGEPQVRALLVVDALRAGPSVLQRRAQILGQLSEILQEGGSRAGSAETLPPHTGEGVVGALFGMLHGRLLQATPGAMLELLNPLMGMVALAYLGSDAAQRELERPAPVFTRADAPAPGSSSTGLSLSGSSPDSLASLPMRITYRTLLVLRVIGEYPGASNREVADRAAVSDPGQISRLLTRLEALGLIENAGESQARGEPNQWRLTSRGQEVKRAIQARSSHAETKANRTRESH